MVTASVDQRAPAEQTFPQFAERLRSLQRTLDFLSADPEPVLDLLTRSATHQSAYYEWEAACRTLRGAADELARNRPPKVDRIAVFMPSNVQLYSYVLYLLVPSLFAERIDFRPSRQVQADLVALHELLAPVHQLPLQLRTSSQSEFAAEAVQDSDVVVFTGRYQNAETLRAKLSPGQLLLFMGMGTNPFVIAPDADLAVAARDLADIRLLNSGQDCLAPDAVFVHQSVATPFLARLRSELDARKYGERTDPAADYGPLYYPSAFEDTLLFLARHHADIAHGGVVHSAEMRVDPTVLVRGLEHSRAVPEFFAPVFNLFSWDDEAQLNEVLACNHYSERALGASVYGTASSTVAQLERKHTVTLDSTLFTVDDGNQPFGGGGRMANYIATAKDLRAEPVLVSKAVADQFGGAPRTGS